MENKNLECKECVKNRDLSFNVIFRTGEVENGEEDIVIAKCNGCGKEYTLVDRGWYT